MEIDKDTIAWCRMILREHEGAAHPDLWTPTGAAEDIQALASAYHRMLARAEKAEAEVARLAEALMAHGHSVEEPEEPPSPCTRCGTPTLGGAKCHTCTIDEFHSRRAPAPCPCGGPEGHVPGGVQCRRGT